MPRPLYAGAINGNFDLQHFFEPITKQQTSQKFNFAISLVERNNNLLHEIMEKVGKKQSEHARLLGNSEYFRVIVN